MARYDKEALLADFHTGIYTQRQLADKYGVSKTTVQKLTSGLEPKTADLVTKKLEVIQEDKLLSDQEVTAVDRAVSFKEKMLGDIELFSYQAMRRAGDLLTASETGTDFKAIIDGVDKLSITTGVNERHAKPAQVQQNTQNNGTTELVITRAIREN